MPNNTPTHGFRVADRLWDAAKAVTAEHGETVTDVLVRALEHYVSSHGYGVDPVTALERLARLHTAGGLTDAEWTRKRRELLDRI